MKINRMELTDKIKTQCEKSQLDPERFNQIKKLYIILDLFVETGEKYEGKIEFLEMRKIINYNLQNIKGKSKVCLKHINI